MSRKLPPAPEGEGVEGAGVQSVELQQVIEFVVEEPAQRGGGQPRGRRGEQQVRIEGVRGSAAGLELLVEVCRLDRRPEPGGEDQAGALPDRPGVVAVPLLIFAAGAEGGRANGRQGQLRTGCGPV
ncbi:hypothetical protein [Micromonospora sp. NPDC023633]|uniref:hypothetical protein n=1 Tax=Micromonospora sp. NPDC023633 TaxID=3154320 RepID=UPI0033E7DA28